MNKSLNPPISTISIRRLTQHASYVGIYTVCKDETNSVIYGIALKAYFQICKLILLKKTALQQN